MNGLIVSNQTNGNCTILMNVTIQASNTLNILIIEGFKNPSTVAIFTDSAEVSINDNAGFGMEITT